MNLITFLGKWVNPTKQVRIYNESEYSLAMKFINDGLTWAQVSSKIKLELAFNPQAKVCFAFVPSKVAKAEVKYFVTCEDFLLVFVSK